MQEHFEDRPQNRVVERNLGACLALKNTIEKAVLESCGFSCEYPPDMKTLPEPKIVSGNPFQSAIDALLDFAARYEIDEDVWEWMLAIVISSLENHADYWKFMAEGELECWQTKQWMRDKLTYIKLGWILGNDDSGYREQTSQYMIWSHVANLVKDALLQWTGGWQDDNDHEDSVPV